MRIERIQQHTILPSKGATLSTYNAKGIITERAITFENWKHDQKDKNPEEKKSYKDNSKSAYQPDSKPEQVEDHIIDLRV